MGPILDPSRGPLGPILGPSWAHLGPSRGPLGAILEPSWALSGSLGPCWADLALILSSVGATLGRLPIAWPRHRYAQASAFDPELSHKLVGHGLLLLLRASVFVSVCSSLSLSLSLSVRLSPSRCTEIVYAASSCKWSIRGQIKRLLWHLSGRANRATVAHTGAPKARSTTNSGTSLGELSLCLSLSLCLVPLPRPGGMCEAIE